MSKICPISIPLKYTLDRIPRIAVVDLPTPREVDIDGDGEPCISHRDAISGLIAALLPEAEVKLYDLVRPDKPPDRSITEAFEELFKDINSGERFDVVTASVGQGYTIANLLAMTGLPLSLHNVGEFREQVKRTIMTIETPQYPLFFPDQEIAAIEKVISTGVPVLLSGNSSGHDTFTNSNFTTGGINVGALDANGDYELSCSTHTIIDRYTRGVYNLYPVEGGYSIFKEGPCNFSRDITSGGDPLVQEFVGKHINTVLATNADIELYKKHADFRTQDKVDASALSKKLFTHSQMNEINPNYNELCQCYPHWRSHGEYLDFEQETYYKVDKNGYVYYDPDNSGQIGAVSKLRGCSYATPTMAVLIAIEKCGNLLN